MCCSFVNISKYVKKNRFFEARTWDYILNNSKFSQVTQFRENFQKIQNLKKFKRSNRFWSNSIPKVLDRFIIFVCIFRTLAQILRMSDLPQTFFKKFKIQSNFRLGINLHEIRHDWRGVTASLLNQILTRYLKPFMNYSALKIKQSST